MSPQHIKNQEKWEQNNGYQQSPELTVHGLTLHFWRAAPLSIFRRSSLGIKTVNLGARCGINLTEVRDLAKQQIKKKYEKPEDFYGELRSKSLRKEWNGLKIVQKILHD